MSRTIIVRTRGGERRIPPTHYSIDRNTGLGEDADYYEHRPYGGRRWISPRDIIRFEPEPLQPNGSE